MIRVWKVTHKLNACRALFHSVKSFELDEPAYHKKPINPRILSLVKKYDPDIFYSSHIELNKKPLTYKQRMDLMQKIRSDEFSEHLKKANEGEPSIFAAKLSEISESKQNLHPPLVQPSSMIVNEIDPTANSIEKLQLSRSKLKILTEMGMRRSAIEHEMQEFPDNWMEDYETYHESDITADTQYGTPDPSVPISKVPCHGCGAMLQCANNSIPGYLPSELMRGHEKNVLQRMICQRCHFLKNYNTALKVQVNAEDYVNMIAKIKDEIALAILMVDLVDMPGSIWPNILDIIGKKRPVIVVGNKVDLLPQDSKHYLKHIINVLESSLIDSGLTQANIKHIRLISAHTNYGIENLITSLYQIWPNKGDVYLMGNANVGKSTLFNALLRSDYCKIRARNLIRRATSSLWPGTTLRMLKFPITRPSNALLHEREKRLKDETKIAQELQRLRQNQVYSGRKPEKTLMEHIGLTFELLPESKKESEISLTDAPPQESYFNENHKSFAYGKWLYDTPGVIHNEQIINLLTSDELLYTIPKETLWPRVFYMIPGQTLFLSGLGRIDYIGGASRMRLAVYASNALSILIVSTKKADEIYRECLGTELLNVPRGDEKRLQQWPQLERHEEKISVGNYNDNFAVSICDIVLSSAGWVSVNVPSTETAHFHAWTPERKGIFVRRTPLLPYAASLYRGKRQSFSPAYSQREPYTVNY